MLQPCCTAEIWNMRAKALLENRPEIVAYFGSTATF